MKALPYAIIIKCLLRISANAIILSANAIILSANAIIWW